MILYSFLSKQPQYSNMIHLHDGFLVKKGAEMINQDYNLISAFS